MRVYDPVAAEGAREMLGGATIASSAQEALEGADGAVLVTEWAEFGELDWAGLTRTDARAADRRRPQLPRRRGAA